MFKHRPEWLECFLVCLLKHLKAGPWRTFGMKRLADCEPGLIGQHKWPTSVMLFVANPCGQVPKFWWKAWNQKSYVIIEHVISKPWALSCCYKGVKFEHPHTFGHLFYAAKGNMTTAAMMNLAGGCWSVKIQYRQQDRDANLNSDLGQL